MLIYSALFDCGLGHLLTPIKNDESMFSSSTEERVKNSIITAFTKPDSFMWIIFATIAFGMGLDAPDIARIIHFGPSDTIETYLQETGRCGHDGRSSTATLYYRKRDLASTSPVSESMKHFCGNSDNCRRRILMRKFQLEGEVSCPSPIHQCCDICHCKCECEPCVTPDQTNTSTTSGLSQQLHALSHHQQQTLLTVYRDGQCGSEPVFCGKEIASSLPNCVIATIVNLITNPSDVAAFGVSSVQARQMYGILQSTL